MRRERLVTTNLLARGDKADIEVEGLRALPDLRLREKCWSRKRYVIWWPARDYLSRIEAYTYLKACQMSGVYFEQH